MDRPTAARAWIFKSGPAARIRSGPEPWISVAAAMIEPIGAVDQLVLVRMSCARPSETSLSSILRLASAGVATLRRVWLTIAWTMANVFLTRCSSSLVRRRRSRSAAFSLACKASWARRNSVRSRRIFRKPTGWSSSFSSGIISPLAQNRVSSRRRCQRSSEARPWVSACPISRSGTPASQSSGVKKSSQRRPHISASDQPRMRRAPSFQLVTTPFRSMVMMP